MTPDSLDRTVADIFTDVGCAGWLHAQSLAPDGGSYGWRATEPVVLASVYKAALLVSLCRLADNGGIDLAERVTTDPNAVTSGPTGVSILPDPMTTSLRNLAISMMTVSDNGAADIILNAVGVDRLAADIEALGLGHTRVVEGASEQYRRLRAETGTTTTEEAFAVLADPDTDVQVSAYDVAYSAAGSPVDCTRLLAQIWNDTAASSESCAFVRETMRRQVVRSRIASGFPAPMRVAGKTGTIGVIRNEIAVVETPGEYPVAVAVFTMSARAGVELPAVDRAIGDLARAVVTELRQPC